MVRLTLIRAVQRSVGRGSGRVGGVKFSEIKKGQQSGPLIYVLMIPQKMRYAFRELFLKRKAPWQWSIFPRRRRRSIVDATTFHYRVRDGNGWVRCALTTRGLFTNKTRTCESGSVEMVEFVKWSRGADSNRRPLGYEPNELPLLHPATKINNQILLSIELKNLNVGQVLGLLVPLS